MYNQIYSDHNRDVVYESGPNRVDVYYQGWFVVRLFRKPHEINPTINHLENVLRINGHDLIKWESMVKQTKDIGDDYWRVKMKERAKLNI